jgi:RIP metalloprotease RseP
MKEIFGNLWTIVLVVLFFGGSIFVHELGHYIAARKRGLLVPRFSIGFGPKLFGCKIKGTEFIVSLIPLGGYAAVPQLADLKDIEGEYDIPKDLPTATCLDKVVVAFAGPLANVLFAFFLAVFVYCYGLPMSEEMLNTHIGYVPQTLTLANGVVVPSPANEAGLMPNDKILSIDERKVTKFDDIVQLIALGTKKNAANHAISNIEIERDGKKMLKAVKPVLAGLPGTEFRSIGIYPKQTLTIKHIGSSLEGQNTGIMRGDRIVSANEVPIFSVMALRDIVGKNKDILLKIERKDGDHIFEIETIKLAIKKPFLSLILLDEHTIVDMIPVEQEAEAFAEGMDDFSGFQILCNNKKLIGSRVGMIRTINGHEPHSLGQIKDLLTGSSDVSLVVGLKEKTTEIKLPNILDMQLFDTEFHNFLGMTFENEVVIKHPTPTQQIWDTIIVTFRTIGGLFNKNSDISAKHLMGPVGLMETLHTFAKTSFMWLLWFVILLNVNLAILNLLPLPVLDGGVIAIAITEKVTGWKSTGKVFSKIQTVCFALLLGLIIYVTFFDFKRIWRAHHLTFEQTRESLLIIQ